MAFDPNIPYNALPDIPPAQDIETKSVFRKCIDATRKLEGLRQAARRIPNQDVLINSIPLREAQDSSEIENIVTTNDRLFRFANTDSDHADPATREVLRYRTALRNGYDNLKVRPLTVQTALAVCRTINGYDLDVRALPGTTISNRSTGQVVYTPPEGADVIRAKLSNWQAYLHADNGVDPIIRMAVGHYQFEAIHPFPDGNGRTGRVLNILYLIDQKLLDLPILYLSQYINANRETYYRLLSRVTAEGAWEPWILFMLEAVEQTAQWTTAKIEAVRALMDQTVQYVRAVHPKIYSWELVELIFTQPYCRTGDLIKNGIASRNIAAKYLKELAAAGVLAQQKEGREVLYLNTRFLDLLKSNQNDFKPYPVVGVRDDEVT
ncbi:MAG: protein adenylyltransferase Fic [Hyphomicrobium sp.]|uniref:protein adenylyltransferase Fic n=1 Tax=Hyphomicrobium sp. TaxID=82 RepID=UPI003D0F0527